MNIQEIGNQALQLIGFPGTISHIYEGSPQARALAIAWDQTRYETFLMAQPDWARTTAELSLIEEDPPGSFEWLYSYTRPAQCVMPLQVFQQASENPTFIWRPRHLPFDYTLLAIRANINPAWLSFIQVVEDPNLWQQDFLSLFIRNLAEKIQPSLAPRRVNAPNSTAERPERDSEQGA